MSLEERGSSQREGRLAQRKGVARRERGPGCEHKGTLGDGSLGRWAGDSMSGPQMPS